MYSNPTAILKLRSNSESKNMGKAGLNTRIVTQSKIDKVLQQYNRSKANLFTKLNKIEYHDRNLKSQTKILSTAYDDSDVCLKTLVSKIENMIQKEYNFGSESNILDEIKDRTGREES